MSFEEFEDPRAVLKRYDARADKRFSQNFLIRESVVRRIADAFEPGQSVLEIGPGVGTLSAALLRRGCRVTALEADPRMREILAAEFGDALTVIAGDAAKLDVAALVKPPTALAGNLPYAITGQIVRRLVDEQDKLERCVIMVQREVAERLVADPDDKKSAKKMGIASILVQNVFDTELLFEVPPSSFVPAPKVTSAIVSLRPRTPRVPNTESLSTIVRAAYAQRRKTLRNTLKTLADTDALDHGFQASGIDPKRRAETLSIEEFGALDAALTLNKQ